MTAPETYIHLFSKFPQPRWAITTIITKQYNELPKIIFYVKQKLLYSYRNPCYYIFNYAGQFRKKKEKSSFHNCACVTGNISFGNFSSKFFLWPASPLEFHMHKNYIYGIIPLTYLLILYWSQEKIR